MRRFVLLILLVTLSMSLFAAVLWAGDAHLAGSAEIAGPGPLGNTAVDTDRSLPLPAGRWECWDDGSLDPCHRDQVAIQAFAENDIWIGSWGNNAAGIRHFDGQEWSELTPHRENIYQHDLRDLSMLSPTFGLAVGSHESWRWDGQQWLTEEIDHGWSFMNLSGVDVYAVDDAWAAGSGYLQGSTYGSLAHWDGSGWTVFTATQTLNAVSMNAGNDAWAVGAGGAAYHWDGLEWHDESWSGGEELFGVASLSGGKAWAVGSHGSLLYYDGDTWHQETLTTTRTLYDIVMPAAGQGWVVGDGGLVFEYDGQDWAEIPVPDQVTLKAVDVLEGGRIYALGYDGELYSKIWAGSWSTLYQAPPRDWLFDIAMITPDDGWVVGNFGRCQHWDGNTWSTVSLPFNANLNALDFLTSDDGWGVGNGGATLHWDGNDWSATTPVTKTVLRDVDLISPTLGFAVGFNGAILKYDGNDWQEFPSPTELSLSALEMVSPDDGWAVGGDYLGSYVDVILRWDGQEWTHFLPEDHFGGIFNGLSVVNPESVYATQSFGLYQFNGISWQKGANTRGGLPSDVDMFSDDEGWVTSVMGAISHWDGRYWEIVFNDTPPIDTVQVLSHDEAWAVTGANSGGAILHYTAPAQVSAGLYPGMILSQTYPGHVTAITPIGAGNGFTITYKLRMRQQGSSLTGVDHFFELGASTTPFTAEVTILIDDPEAYGVMAPFLRLRRLVDNLWVDDDILLLSHSYDPQAPRALKQEYQVKKAGSYGLLLDEPDFHVYLPFVIKH